MVPRTARVAVVVSAIFAFVGAGFWIHAVLFTQSQIVPVRAGLVTSTADALQSAFVSVAERVRPAVVHIGTAQVARSRRRPATPGPRSGDPVRKDFFDQTFGPSGSGRHE